MLKHYLPLALLFGLLVFLVGCDNFENPVSSPELTAIEENTSQEMNFITLPKPDGFFKPLKTSATITPQTGGRLALNYSQGRGSERVHIQVSLRFAPRSVSEDVTASMSVDSDALMFYFEPSGTTFLKPGQLTVNARGLDLSDVPAGAEIKLYYIDGDQWEEMNTQMIRYDVRQGQLQCVNGEVPHFSRYAFAF